MDGESRIIACGVWQSGAMLDDFDRYGSYCCLDAMMRVLNTSGLPYLAIVVFDETRSMVQGGDYSCIYSSRIKTIQRIVTTRTTVNGIHMNFFK